MSENPQKNSLKKKISFTEAPKASIDRKVLSVSPDKKTILVSLVNPNLIGTPIPLHYTHEGRRYRFLEKLRQIPPEIILPSSETIHSLNKYELIEEQPQKPKPQTPYDSKWDTHYIHRTYSTPLSRF